MKINKNIESDFEKYKLYFGSNKTLLDYQNYLKESNKNYLEMELKNFLTLYGYGNANIKIESDKIKVLIKNQENKDLAIITTHWDKISMAYCDVETKDIVKILSHIWYSFRGGFESACLTGNWDLPEKFESDNLLLEIPYKNNNYNTNWFLLRTQIISILISEKYEILEKYIEVLTNLANNESYGEKEYNNEYYSKEYLDSIQTDLYNERSIINKQVDLRDFIEVETY